MTSRGDPRGYYAALGLPVTATAEDIRRAFGERAKQLHPDGVGGGRDPEAFQRVLDAYEVLRDPSRRLRYDAASVDMDRGDPYQQAEMPAPDPLARGWSPQRLWPRLRQTGRVGGLSRARPRLHMAMMLGALSFLAVGGVGWGCARQTEVVQREQRISELTVDVERARAEQAEANARYRAASVVTLEEALAQAPAQSEPSHVFAADLKFEPGSADLGPELNQQLVEAIEQVSTVVTGIPPDRRWLVLIQGQAPKAASAAGVEVAGWQLSLLRISQVLDRLVQAGLPADRVAMRFSAGFAPEAQGPDPARTVELRVVCCLR